MIVNRALELLYLCSLITPPLPYLHCRQVSSRKCAGKACSCLNSQHHSEKKKKKRKKTSAQNCWSTYIQTPMASPSCVILPRQENSIFNTASHQVAYMHIGRTESEASRPQRLTKLLYLSLGVQAWLPVNTFVFHCQSALYFTFRFTHQDALIFYDMCYITLPLILSVCKVYRRLWGRFILLY